MHYRREGFWSVVVVTDWHRIDQQLFHSTDEYYINDLARQLASSSVSKSSSLASSKLQQPRERS